MMLNAWHLPVPPFVKQSKDQLLITLWLTGEDPPQRIMLRTEHDNEEMSVPMHKQRSQPQPGVTAWRAAIDLSSGQPRRRYSFKLLWHDRQRWFTPQGFSRMPPARLEQFAVDVPDIGPQWAADQIFYQIFPDRFARSLPREAEQDHVYYHHAAGQEIILRDWDEPVTAQAGGSTFYGGDLDGISEKLPYLKKLGVTALYLNPVFKAPSVHKYDTEDYRHVDAQFGGDEALLRLPKMKNADLSCLKGVYSGGDSLSVELKKRFDQFLFDHHATIQVREGYGLTECVTASCLTPYHISREGSIGIPFPDTYYKIVEHGTQKEVPYGTEGEICLSGPTVMMGYLHHPEETAQTLQTHEDGLAWVHTGDLGYMDPDGFVYFRQRLKRMIVTSGYNVYPSQMENIFDAHELVQMSCVIGVPDKLKMQKVKAFVMLKPGVSANEETKDVLMTYIRKNVAKYALPYDIEFRAELPKTLVGKVAYRVLEEEENAKQAQKAVEDAKRAEEDAKRAEAAKAEKLSAAKKPAAKKPAPKKPAHPTAKPEPAKQTQKADTPHDGQNNDIKE